MIIMFGDHYPGLDQVEEFLSGAKREDLEADREELYYETPFFIWTNYESPTATDVITSCNFLGTLALSDTGLLQTPWNHYLQMLGEEMRSFNHIGYHDAQGRFIAWKDAPDEAIKRRDEYEYLQYNALVEKMNRADWFFSIEGE